MNRIFRVMVVLSALALAHPVQAQIDRSFAPIFVDPAVPDEFFLIGDIDVRTPFSFQRAVTKYGTPLTLQLTSDGGSVHAGLSLALEVHRLGISTSVEEGCYSACFFVFAAGKDRVVNGELGVHQISSDSGSLETGQVAVADLIEVMNEFGVDPDILVLMLRTAADDMYVFSGQEIAQYGLSTSGSVTVARRAPTLTSVQAPVPLIDRALSFVEQHNRIWSQTNSTALAEIAPTYSSVVKFYGEPWSHADVMEEKRKFAERWPVRDYNFRPTTSASYCSSESECVVEGVVEWYAHSPGRSATSVGTAEVSMRLELVGNSFTIVGEDGRVISRR